MLGPRGLMKSFSEQGWRRKPMMEALHWRRKETEDNAHDDTKTRRHTL